jgi:hypothetical protein
MIHPLKPRCFSLFTFILTAAVLHLSIGNVRAQMPAAGAPAAAQQAEQMQAKEAAQAAATAWLQLLDAGKYDETWQTAASSFHTAITEQGWVSLLKTGLPVFGKVLARKADAVSYSRILPGAPNGQYVAIDYQTNFANSKAAHEIVTVALEPGGTWKVCGYHIK